MIDVNVVCSLFLATDSAFRSPGTVPCILSVVVGCGNTVLFRNGISRVKTLFVVQTVLDRPNGVVTNGAISVERGSSGRRSVLVIGVPRDCDVGVTCVAVRISPDNR